MAIALNTNSCEMFEVDFHDLERALLARVGGCVKKVIMLMKYYRDTKGGTLTKLWSYLLKVLMKNIKHKQLTLQFKTTVMNHLVREEPGVWDNSNLAKSFLTCMRNLWIGLQKGMIQDTFYPDVNISF